MRAYRLSALCDDVQATIEAMDGTAWATPSLTSPTWRHAKQSLTEAVGSALDQHLLFSVTVEGASATGHAGQDSYQVVADLVVAFMFKLGADAEIARERLAMDAAADVVGALLNARHATMQNIECVQAFTPGAKVGDFLPVECRFAVLIDIGYRFR